MEEKTPWQLINEAISGKVPQEKFWHIQMVIIPSVLMDFHRMVNEALEGEAVKEEYHLDDRTLVITLTGRKEGGVPKIISADVKTV